MTFALAICFLLMAATGYWYSKSLFSPYTLCAGSWGIILLLFSIVSEGLLPVEGRFPVAISIWMAGFCAAAAAAEYVTPEGRTRLEPGPTTFPLIIALAFISSAVIVIGTIRFALSYPGDFFLTLRSANTGLDVEMAKSIPTFGPLQYLSSALTPVYLVLLSLTCSAGNDKKNRRLFAAALILCLATAFVGMGKTAFFGIFFTTVLILSIERRIKIIPLLLGIAGLFCIFTVIQFVRETAMGNVFSMNSFFNTYLFSGIVAFDCADLGINWEGSNSLRFFHALASSAGAQTEVSDTILDYTMAGTDTITNIYTVLFPFYTDFGMLGVGIFSIISGAIAGFLYKRAGTSGACKALYAIVASYIVLQFTGEFIFTNASLFIQHCLYCIVMFIPVKLNLFKCDD